METSKLTLKKIMATNLKQIHKTRHPKKRRKKKRKKKKKKM